MFVPDAHAKDLSQSEVLRGICACRCRGVAVEPEPIGLEIWMCQF
jgi:hypothetical protein